MDDPKRPAREKKPVSRLSVSTPGTCRSWSDEEKWQLLHCLRKYSVYDIDKLQEAIPSRNKDEILNYIGLWRRLGRTSLKPNYKKKKGVKLTPGVDLLEFDENSLGHGNDHRAPIQKWLDYMAENTPTNLIRRSKLIAKAFKYIADYENHPPPEELGGVNLRDLYEFMHCVLNGDPPKWLNKESIAFLFQSLDHLKLELKKLGCGIEKFLQNADGMSYEENEEIEHIFNVEGFDAFQMPEEELLKWDGTCLDPKEVAEIVKRLSSCISIMKNKSSTDHSKDIVTIKETDIVENEQLLTEVKVEISEEPDIDYKQNIACPMIIPFSDNIALRKCTGKENSIVVQGKECNVAVEVDTSSEESLISPEDIKVEKDMPQIDNNNFYNQINHESLSENKVAGDTSNAETERQIAPISVKRLTQSSAEREEQPCKDTHISSECDVSLNPILVSNKDDENGGDKDERKLCSSNISPETHIQETTEVHNITEKVRQVCQSKVQDSVEATLDEALFERNKSVRMENKVSLSEPQLKKQRNRKTISVKTVDEQATDTSEMALEVDKQDCEENSTSEVQKDIKIHATVPATSNHEYKETIPTEMQCDLKDELTNKIIKSKSKQTNVKKYSFSTDTIKHSNIRKSKRISSINDQCSSDLTEDITNKTRNGAIIPNQAIENIVSVGTLEIGNDGTTDKGSSQDNISRAVLKVSKTRGKGKRLTKLQYEIEDDTVNGTFERENIPKKARLSKDLKGDIPEAEFESNDDDKSKCTKVKDDTLPDLVKSSNIRRSKRISSLNVVSTKSETGPKRTSYNRKCKNYSLITLEKEVNSEEDSPDEILDNITPSVNTCSEKSKNTISTKGNIFIDNDEAIPTKTIVNKDFGLDKCLLNSENKEENSTNNTDSVPVKITRAMNKKASSKMITDVGTDSEKESLKSNNQENLDIITLKNLIDKNSSFKQKMKKGKNKKVIKTKVRSDIDSLETDKQKKSICVETPDDNLVVSSPPFSNIPSENMEANLTKELNSVEKSLDKPLLTVSITKINDSVKLTKNTAIKSTKNFSEVKKLTNTVNSVNNGNDDDSSIKAVKATQKTKNVRKKGVLTRRDGHK